MDWLAASLGMLKGDVPDEALPDLVDGAEAFLRAGGHLTRFDWGDLSPTGKAAFVAAGNRIRAEMATFIGLASQSAMDALRVSDPDAATTAEADAVLANVMAEKEKAAKK